MKIHLNRKRLGKMNNFAPASKFKMLIFNVLGGWGTICG